MATTFGRTKITTLPYDCLEQIVKLLDLQDTLALKRSCTTLHHRIGDTTIRQKCSQILQSQATKHSSLDTKTLIKETYNHLLLQEPAVLQETDERHVPFLVRDIQSLTEDSILIQGDQTVHLGTLETSTFKTIDALYNGHHITGIEVLDTDRVVIQDDGVLLFLRLQGNTKFTITRAVEARQDFLTNPITLQRNYSNNLCYLSTDGIGVLNALDQGGDNFCYTEEITSKLLHTSTLTVLRQINNEEANILKVLTGRAIGFDSLQPYLVNLRTTRTTTDYLQYFPLDFPECGIQGQDILTLRFPAFNEHIIQLIDKDTLQNTTETEITLLKNPEGLLRHLVQLRASNNHIPYTRQGTLLTFTSNRHISTRFLYGNSSKAFQAIQNYKRARPGGHSIRTIPGPCVPRAIAFPAEPNPSPFRTEIIMMCLQPTQN